jgi:hypothetical protein
MQTLRQREKFGRSVSAFWKSRSKQNQIMALSILHNNQQGQLTKCPLRTVYRRSKSLIA